MVTELKKEWMSSSPTQQMPQDHEVSLLNTYPRYDTSCKKTPKGRSIRQLKHLYECKILCCRIIMVLMIACCNTNTYRITSSWTPSSPLRRVGDPHKGTNAANSLSQTKDSYTLYQCEGNRKSFKRSNSFAKEIGVPTSIIADMSGEQMSHDVRKFCNNIGTTLRALEEGTPWSNKVKLYIGLLKEAV